MEEYERLEQELEGMYQIYIEKYRNIDYLEQELEKYNKTEEQKLKRAKDELLKIQKKIKEQEMKDFKRVEELDDGLLQPEEERGFTRGNSRKQQRGGGLRQQQRGAHDGEGASEGEDEEGD